MAEQPATLTFVQAAKQGDESAFEILLEPLLEQGYRLACAILHDHHAAEDAVQEAAFEAWLKVSQLREDSEIRPWFEGVEASGPVGEGPSIFLATTDGGKTWRNMHPRLAA